MFVLEQYPSLVFSRTIGSMAKCSRCENEAVSYHRWCRECFNSYKRGYRKVTKSLGVRKAFRTGAQLMQQSIVAQLRNLGSSDLNGFAAANLAERLEIPNAVPNSQL